MVLLGEEDLVQMKKRDMSTDALIRTKGNRTSSLFYNIRYSTFTCTLNSKELQIYTLLVHLDTCNVDHNSVVTLNFQTPGVDLLPRVF